MPFTCDRRNASSTDAGTWATFGRVIEAYNAGGYDGVGFVFARDGGIVGVDLDGCFDGNGTLEPRAKKIVDAFGSYTEYSVSGKGLHIIVKASLKSGKRNGPVEIYPHGRFFTMTGHVLNDPMPVMARQSVVDSLVQMIAPPRSQPARTHQPRRHYLNNDELIEKAKAAKNGHKFSPLWSGDTSGYPSQSEADLALLAMLLFWTNGDEERASILFSQSGLYRQKWERADYRRRCFEFLRGRMSA